VVSAGHGGVRHGGAFYWLWLRLGGYASGRYAQAVVYKKVRWVRILEGGNFMLKYASAVLVSAILSTAVSLPNQANAATIGVQNAKLWRSYYQSPPYLFLSSLAIL
jgi:hypothetical protein